jgi:hypothetical protein
MILTLSILVSLSLAAPVLPQEPFLEGFPDVPLLKDMHEIHPTSRFVFDTPTGTVAETILTTDLSISEVIIRYNINLIALGWECAPQSDALMCLREKHKLALTFQKSVEKKTLIKLRVEPVQK